MNTCCKRNFVLLFSNGFLFYNKNVLSLYLIYFEFGFDKVYSWIEIYKNIISKYSQSKLIQILSEPPDSFHIKAIK